MTSAIFAGDVQVEKSAPGMAARLAGVSMVVGDTALTRRSVDASSRCSVSVNTTTPAFDALYAAIPAGRVNAACEATLMIEPRLRRIIPGSTARAMQTAVRTLMRYIRSQMSIGPS